MAQTVAAQQSVYIVTKQGGLKAFTANKVAFEDNLFNFTDNAVTEISQEAFAASFKVDFSAAGAKNFTQTPEIGICFSDINSMPTIKDGRLAKTDVDNSKWVSADTKTFSYSGSFTIHGLEAGTKYYYRTYVKTQNAVFYGNVCQVTTEGTKPAGEYVVVDGRKFVDLGLPSKTLWAACNVGANVPAEDGGYFAWGETKANSKYYGNSISDYKFYSSDDTYSSDYGMTKYNSTDSKTTLDPQDDAAFVNWGASYRMPSKENFAELLNSEYCTWTYDQTKKSVDGNKCPGYIVTSKKNGNSIYFTDFRYWTSDLASSHGKAYDFYPSDNAYGTSSMYPHDRYSLYCIRPVTTATPTTATQEVSSAQQNMWMTDADGGIDAVTLDSVKYSTFTADHDWLKITNGEVSYRNTYQISASCNIACGGDEVVSLLTTPKVIGVCYSETNTTPTVGDLCQSFGSTAIGEHTYTLSCLTPGTTYYYRVYVRLAGEVFYGDVASVTTLGEKPNDKTVDGHVFKDMGLPSGTLWAETNVGADTYLDAGNYYAWGETSTKDSYTDYTYNPVSSSTTRASVISWGKKSTDAAYVNWNKCGVVPSSTQLEELTNTDNCTWTSVTKYKADGTAVKGYEVVSKKNGNAIFLPGAGFKTGSETRLSGTGYYMSSTDDTQYKAFAYFLIGCKVTNYYNYYGYNVRPVYNNEKDNDVYVDIDDSDNWTIKGDDTTTR